MFTNAYDAFQFPRKDSKEKERNIIYTVNGSRKIKQASPSKFPETFERFLRTKTERMYDNFLFSLLQMGAPRVNYMYNTEKHTINLLRNISRNKARTFRERSLLTAADIRQRKS